MVYRPGVRHWELKEKVEEGWHVMTSQGSKCTQSACFCLWALDFQQFGMKAFQKLPNLDNKLYKLMLESM